jgi:Domain of unknown function (DUF927)
MNTRRFLELVWPAEGPYCIATPWVKRNGETVMAHHGCETIDDAIAYVLTKKQTNDLYFAPHALRVVREVNPKTGKFQTFRTHENMKEARAFFFDIDLKHYPTQSDILSALEKFLFVTCLPAPLVVSSGYGIHVYWIIDTPIESLAWCEPAARLFWLAQHHGLHVDPSRTTDQSSVLRVPNTFNFKDPANPRKVEVLFESVSSDKFLDQLDNLTSNYVRSEAVRCISGDIKGIDTLSVAWDGRRPPADEVADVCEHMRVFRDSRGNIPEPLWHVGVGTIKHCDDGAAKVHEWSSGYPGYTPAETQRKLDTWVMPPPGCEKIDHNSGDPAVCARCPHRDLAKNPGLIANVVYEKTHQPVPGPAPTSMNGATPTPPCLPPEPYTLDMTYGVKEKGKGLICDWPMFPVQWVKATTNESCLSHWYVKPPLGDWERIEVLNDELELKNLAPALRNKGIITTHLKYTKNLHMFMLAYAKELRRHQADLHQYDYIGFETAPKSSGNKSVEFGDPKYFIMYGRKISVTDGSIVPCVMTRNTQIDGMGQAGSLAQQIALMEFYNKPQYMAQQFAIAASLATPFFVYSNQHGVLVCLVGETGASKSTGAFSAASLWGHPERYCISGLTSNATDKARQELESICRNQPFVVDEITLFPKEVVNEIALAASQLGGRKSLKSNREFRDERGGYKANLTICTSNTSLIQKINATNPGGQASIMRIFEIKVVQNDARSKAEADRFMRQLVRNYGWIGEDFLRRCLPHREAIGDKFLEIQQQLETDIGARPEERFMTAAAATALLGIRLGNKLRYFNYSYRAMREWLINVQIPAMRATVEHERKNMAPETILNEYLETIAPNMCRVNKNTRGEIEILYAPPTAEYKARYEIPRAEVYVRIGPFKDYCNERHHDYSDVLDRLYRGGSVIVKSDKKRMRAEPGTLDNPVACFVVSVTATSPIAVPKTPEARKIVEFPGKKP